MGMVFSGILLGLSIAAPIGPTNIEIIRRGVNYGWKSATKFSLGVLIALVLYLILVLLGFSILLHSTVFKYLLSLFGIVVLAYLAFNSICDFRNSKELTVTGVIATPKNNLVDGFVLTIFNPAVLLLWTGILGASFDASKSAFFQNILLCCGIITGVFIFFSVLLLVLNKISELLKYKYFNYISLISGLILLFFCVKFSYGLLQQTLELLGR